MVLPEKKLGEICIALFSLYVRSILKTTLHLNKIILLVQSLIKRTFRFEPALNELIQS